MLLYYTAYCYIITRMNCYNVVQLSLELVQKRQIKISFWGGFSCCVIKGLKPYGVVSGADGADSSPVIKASQEKRTRH